MNPQRLSKQILFLTLTGTLLFFGACAQKPEEVNIAELLPEDDVKEIKAGYPDFKMTLVAEKDANVYLMFDKKNIRIDGVDKKEIREKLAKYIIQYLENPNKKLEDAARRKAYQSLTPEEKLADLIKRIKEKYPDFEYDWVGLGAGNVKAEYGDNSLVVSGVDSEGVRREIAHAIILIQKEMDSMDKEEE